ncbi:MAG: winged helix DNA-binding protein [Lachnospiraceae bacterium]|nr:winged helix DNA-binding protein [Lachnospiraceae bacterium]
MYHLFDTLTVVYKYKKLYERRCQGVMKKYDLRIADIDVLHYVSRAGDKNLSKDIVDEGMSKANVSKSVEHLHQKGYVELYEDKTDRRCVHIKPTEAAEPIIIEVEQIRKDMGASLASGITPEDKEATFRVMQLLCQNMSRELAETEREEI